MSTQSILNNTIESLSNTTDEVLINMGNKYLLNNRFGIGTSYSSSDFKKIMFLRRILCENKCEMSSVIDKVKENLNILTLKYK